jgi:hypothetical protein
MRGNAPTNLGRQIGRTTLGTGTTPTTSAAEEDQPMNLVELSIYGLATLYERFPPKKAESTDAASGSQGAQ